MTDDRLKEIAERVEKAERLDWEFYPACVYIKTSMLISTTTQVGE